MASPTAGLTDAMIVLLIQRKTRMGISGVLGCELTGVPKAACNYVETSDYSSGQGQASISAL